VSGCAGEPIGHSNASTSCSGWVGPVHRPEALFARHEAGFPERPLPMQRPGKAGGCPNDSALLGLELD